MSAEENKAVTRRINDEVWTNGNVEVIDEVIADDYVHTVVGAQEPIRGRQGFRELVTMYRNAFPDFGITTEEQIAEGDVVVTRWTGTGTHRGDLMGIPATGKRSTAAGITIDRFAGGKLVAGWAIFDQLGLLQQLGAVPMPAGG
jgi:steroid delta-isomerase-like uncharacterized protein